MKKKYTSEKNENEKNNDLFFSSQKVNRTYMLRLLKMTLFLRYCSFR